METKQFTINIGIKDILIVILAALLWFSNCSGEKETVEYKKGNYDSLLVKLKQDSIQLIALKEKSIQDSLKTASSEHKTDSIEKVKNKFERLYNKTQKVVLEQLSIGICDTNLIKETFHYCDSTITSAKSESSQKDTTIASLKKEVGGLKEQLQVSNGMVDASRTILNGQSKDIKALEKKITKTKIRNKIKNVITVIAVAVENTLLILALKK
jgi:PBP1b-binding outer membrane lipoprotein LpoB